MTRYDVIVVGGGPAGSSCARWLRQRGLSVAIVDRAHFPRDKVCAGWVTPPVVELLELDRADYGRGRTLQPVTGFRTGTISGRSVESRYDEVVSYGIRRFEFDHYLLERAEHSGAELHLGETMQSLERHEGEWLFNGTLRAPMLVGAGGHFCPVARTLGNRPGQGEAAVKAQEIEFLLDESQREACPVSADTPELYFCDDLKGYGWAVRKGDYLNVGLGREAEHGLAEHVEAFIARLQALGRIPSPLPGRLHGHAYLLHALTPRKVVDDGVLLIGDAAGLAYPQSGEGIRPAVESALLAANTIVEAGGDYGAASLAVYEKRLEARFGPRHGADSATVLPEGVRTFLGRALLGTRWFSRRVVMERWFLHTEAPPLALSA